MCRDYLYGLGWPSGFICPRCEAEDKGANALVDLGFLKTPLVTASYLLCRTKFLGEVKIKPTIGEVTTTLVPIDYSHPETM